MHYYYKRRVVGSLPSCHRKKNILIVLAFVACPCFSASAQSTDISALLSERSVLIAQGQSTRELDQQLFNANYRPKAIIHAELLENGSRRITFPLYLTLTEDKKGSVVQRLAGHYPYLTSLEIDTDLRQAVMYVPATVSTEELNAIFDHFGYLGYEEH
jgi:hypothetical protein